MIILRSVEFIKILFTISWPKLMTISFYENNLQKPMRKCCKRKFICKSTILKSHPDGITIKTLTNMSRLKNSILYQRLYAVEQVCYSRLFNPLRTAFNSNRAMYHSWF